MTIECPACATRYDMKATLPSEGRTVRCAICETVWRAMPEKVNDFGNELDSTQSYERWGEQLSQLTKPRRNHAREIIRSDTKPTGRSRPQFTKIFMSYRRHDTKAIATLIYGPLSRYFESKFGTGAVFVDVQGIPLGFDFRRYLTEQVTKTELLLVLIADRWLTAVDGKGNRCLDDPSDNVRIEIEAALKGGIPVVPLYIDGVKFLKEDDLPDSLKSLAWRNAYSLDTDSRLFEAHISRLITGLEHTLAMPVLGYCHHV